MHLCFGLDRERQYSLCSRLWVETKAGMRRVGQNKGEQLQLPPRSYYPLPQDTARGFKEVSWLL